MNQLTGLQRADAVIVGGGLTGLLLGASLTQAGMQTAIIDAAKASLAPAETTATVLCAHRYARIEAAHGFTAAQQYAAALQAQLQELLHAAPPYVEKMPVYTYARAEGELPMLEKQHALLSRLGIPIAIAPDTGGCPFPVELSLTAVSQAVVNLYQWQSALKAYILRHGGRIYTDSRVIAIDNSRICTAQGCMDAQHIILTTGKPLGIRSRKLLTLLESRLLVHCTLASEMPLHSCQQPAHEDGLSLTPTATGAAASWCAGRLGLQNQSRRLTEFELLLRRRLPDWQVKETGYSQVLYPLDGLPVIGLIPESRLLCASCYGLLDAMNAAEILTRRILGQAKPEDALYAPDRTLPASILRRKIRRIASIHARNMLRRRAPACAHCSCRLRYSTAVQRWECPYCGTCYTMLGQVISGPGLHAARISIRQRPDI